MTDRAARRIKRSGTAERGHDRLEVRGAGHLVNADVTTSSPSVRLALESKPETLTIVRGMLAGVAEFLMLEPELLDDLKTTVSEACNNVVLHAYPGATGPMEVRLQVDEDRLRVVVADHGVGAPPEALTGGVEGIGMSVIRALVDEVVFSSAPGEGTELQLEFRPRDRGWKLPADQTAPPGELEDAGPGDPGEVLVALTPVPLLSGVLGRLARTLAATAHFSLDRFSDVYLVTDTLAGHAAGASAQPWVTARLAADERRLELTVGPFRPGLAAQLPSEGPGRGPSPLLLLADEVSALEDRGGELWRVVVVDHRRA